jgi:DNA topoisomerase-1
VVTDKQCEQHGLYFIKIVTKGKRPWDIGCPHCNFIEWQKKLEEEKNGSESIVPKAVLKKVTKKKPAKKE